MFPRFSNIYSSWVSYPKIIKEVMYHLCINSIDWKTIFILATLAIASVAESQKKNSKNSLETNKRLLNCQVKLIRLNNRHEAEIIWFSRRIVKIVKDVRKWETLRKIEINTLFICSFRTDLISRTRTRHTENKRKKRINQQLT